MDRIYTDVRRLAGQRNEIITTDLLRDLGVTPRQRKRLLATGLLTPVHRGVYTTTADVATLTPIQVATAACLFAPHAVLSFGTAARVLGVRKAPMDRLEMTIETGNQLHLARVKVHRTNALDPDDINHYLDGLRLTSPERTLFDQAGVLDRRELRSAILHAIQLELTNLESLAEIGFRLAKQGRRGSTDFMEVLLSLDCPAMPPPESDEELVLFDALAQRVPDLERQIRVQLPTRAFVRIDLGVEALKFGVEVDHPFWHANPARTQADKARDLQLESEGWTLPRVTTDQVRHQLRSTVASLEAVYLRVCRRAA